MQLLIRRFSAALMLALWAPVALAGDSDWIRHDFDAVRLVVANSALGPDGEVLAGVQIRLNSQWKTYWRYPGQTGVPTSFDWSGSENVANVDVLWPLPERFSDYELESFGYENEVVFPLRVTAADPSKAAVLSLDVAYGVCREVCMPIEETFSMTIPPGEGVETAHAILIRAFADTLPQGNGAGGMSIEQVRLTDEFGSGELQITARRDGGFKFPDAVVEAPADFFISLPTVDIGMNRETVTLRMPVSSRVDGATLYGEQVRITLWDEDGHAVEYETVIRRQRSSAIGDW